MLRRNSEYLYCLSLDCMCCYRSLLYVIWKQQSMHVMSLLIWSPPSSGFPCLFYCISFPDLRVCAERWNKACCDPAALGAVHRKNPVLATGTPCSCDAAGDDGTVSSGPSVVLWVEGCIGNYSLVNNCGCRISWPLFCSLKNSNQAMGWRSLELNTVLLCLNSSVWISVITVPFLCPKHPRRALPCYSSALSVLIRNCEKLLNRDA